MCELANDDDNALKSVGCVSSSVQQSTSCGGGGGGHKVCSRHEQQLATSMHGMLCLSNSGGGWLLCFERVSEFVH